MKHGFVEFLQALMFGARRIDRPHDLVAFDEARKRLATSARGLAREADEFGKMVRDMRGAKTKNTRKAQSK